MLPVVPRQLTTQRVRTYWEKFAPRYDRSIKFWERILNIPGGRRWVASQAIGDVLDGERPFLSGRQFPKTHPAIGKSDCQLLSVRRQGCGGQWPLKAGKRRLLVSLKSIWKNASGTVPNRIDDLMGETANVQQMSPEIVTGYILLFDAQADSYRREDGRFWSDVAPGTRAEPLANRERGPASARAADLAFPRGQFDA